MSAGPPSSPVWHRRSPLTKETRWGRGSGRDTTVSTCASEEARQCHMQAKLILASPIENLSIGTFDSWLSEGRGRGRGTSGIHVHQRRHDNVTCKRN